MKLLYAVTVAAVVLFGLASATEDEDKAKVLLKKLNEDFATTLNTFLELLWKYETNTTDENLYDLEQVGSPTFEYDDEDLPWDSFTDKDVVRQATLFGIYKTSNTKPLDYFKELDDSISGMLLAYNNVTICDYANPKSCGEEDSEGVDIEEVFATSKNPAELLYYWKSYNDQLGPVIRKIFASYVVLGNEPSKMDGYPSKAEDWLSEFEQPAEDVEKAFKEVVDTLMPFYQELQAYVRYALNGIYGNDIVKNTGAIPAHVLGSLEAADWQGLYDKLVPYPNAKESVSVDDILKNKNLSPLQIFQLVEKNFKDINMKPMTETFWAKSLIEEPMDREATCDSSAWNFYKGDDYRIEHCTEQTEMSLVSVYNLMTLIEYYMYCGDQPTIYQSAPLSGFDEAVVTAIRRAVRSKKHLNNIGLVDKIEVPDAQQEINELMSLALYYVPYTMYSYTLDSWRRQVFQGKIPTESLNSAFWEMRQKYTGVAPPIPRTEETLDAAADSAIPSDDNMNYEFTRMVLSFQFYREFCKLAGESDSGKPLHRCDFTSSPEVGKKLGEMMAAGRSVSWDVALQKGIGVNKFDATAMVDYFQPLYTFLKEQNSLHGVTPGF